MITTVYEVLREAYLAGRVTYGATMPIYSDLPVLQFNESFLRLLVQATFHRPPKSILDVGAGHGGVYDYGYWDAMPNIRREACDLHWIRPMSERWLTRIGVDVCDLPYDTAEFDVVQCMEVLEHVPDTRRALEELLRVTNRLLVISSADEMHHQGPEQAAIELVNPNQKYLGQPKVVDLMELGFTVYVGPNRRQLFAWKVR